MKELIEAGTLNEEILKREAFGIFRLVTDDGDFEESEIGKELIELSRAMRQVNLNSS